MGLRVTLLSVDEVRELAGVADKEDRGVVEDPVKVALVRLDFDCKAYDTLHWTCAVVRQRSAYLADRGQCLRSRTRRRQ